MDDIGYLLFKEVLGMSQYPASPFTGVILKDLVLFFLIPTIFIILVIYMMLGRMFYPQKQAGLRLLVGIGAYLFIVFSGYFSVFAMIAGPYFIFLIFILGLLYVFLEHFSRRQGTSAGLPAGGGYGLPGGGVAASSMSRPELKKRFELIDAKIKKLEGQRDNMLNEAQRGGGVRLDATIRGLNESIADLERQKIEMEMQLYPHKKYSFNW